MKEYATALFAAICEEADCFELYVENQKLLDAAVLDRDWPALERALSVLQGFADKAGRLEKEREAAYAAFLGAAGLDAGTGLYRAALATAEPQRTNLGNAFRRLKLAAMRARIGTRIMDDSVSSGQATLRLVLDELFPEKRGKIYGSTGKPAPADYPSLVLDTAM